MSYQHYDVVVIGTGPGGEGAAMRLAKKSRRVAVVEAYREVGGGCVHWGTIPSKSLRQNIQMLADFRRNPLFSEVRTHLNLTYPALLRNAESVIANQVRLRHRYYTRNGVDVIHGQARFVDLNTVEVVRTDNASERYRADQFVVATGSRPYHPPELDFASPRILDSDTVLGLGHTPRSVTIYGAGVIGCEYASIFANLDVKVNLVNTRSHLLSYLDDEITDALGYYLRSQGVIISHDETYARVETLDHGVILHCESGKRFKTDVLLWANGRAGNTEDMGLESIGVGVNHRGQIEVNDCFRTAQPHIYAVGDVIGPPGLASASYDQGRFAAGQIVDGTCDYALVEDMPVGIYTSPEISSIGRTERELTHNQIPYEVGRADFKNLARAQIMDHRVGMLKILFHRETLEILGIHCFGEQASEIIHIGQAIMRQPGVGNNLTYFINTTFNYPTMAEAYRVAALNGHNRLF